MSANFASSPDPNIDDMAYRDGSGTLQRSTTVPDGEAMEAARDGRAEAPEASNPSERQTPALSHDTLAVQIGLWGFDQYARYVAAWGKWLFWNNVYWCKAEKGEDMSHVRQFLRTKADQVLAWADHAATALLLKEPGAEKKATDILKWARSQANALLSRTCISAVESLARSNPGSAASAEDFDRDHMLLGTPAGTVDLRTGKVRPTAPSDMITRQTAVGPSQGEPVRWLSFLDQVFDGDPDMIAFMQRAAGYALTGETREHKLLFLYGSGRNGKSVFLSTLMAIFGTYARKAPADMFLSRTGERHPTDLAGLKGARLVVASELPRGKAWDEAAIKDMTGGDRLTARFMHQDYFDFEPQFTLMIAGNTMPAFGGLDEGIRARVVLVPFTVTIPPEKRDVALVDKLMQEAPQILNWAIQGAVEWNRRGLDVPARISQVSQEYFENEDTLGQFIQDEVIASPMGFVSNADLYDRYGLWCLTQGIPAWTQRNFTKGLQERGLQARRTARDRGFAGVALRDGREAAE